MAVPAQANFRSALLKCLQLQREMCLMRRIIYCKAHSISICAEIWSNLLAVTLSVGSGALAATVSQANCFSLFLHQLCRGERRTQHNPEKCWSRQADTNQHFIGLLPCCLLSEIRLQPQWVNSVLCHLWMSRCELFSTSWGPGLRSGISPSPSLASCSCPVPAPECLRGCIEPPWAATSMHQHS